MPLSLLSTNPVPGFHRSPGVRTLKIGDLAKQTRKSARALRLYEELGLLTPGTRTAGGFRLYGTEAIDRVHWIGKLQELGFTLQQLQELVDATSKTGVAKDAMARVRTLYADKQAEVSLQIRRLQDLQRELASSLAYLETCASDCTAVGQSSACCGSCQAHGDVRAPSLVHGIQDSPPHAGAVFAGAHPGDSPDVELAK